MNPLQLKYQPDWLWYHPQEDGTCFVLKVHVHHVDDACIYMYMYNLYTEPVHVHVRETEFNVHIHVHVHVPGFLPSLLSCLGGLVVRVPVM